MSKYRDSLRKTEKITKTALALISVIFSIFLILLGNKVLDDVDGIFKRPKMTDFKQLADFAELDGKIEPLNGEAAKLREQRENYEKTLGAVRKNYDSEKKAFDTWIQTRQAIGRPTEDNTIIVRARKLDEYKNTEILWQNRISQIDSSIQKLNKEKEGFEKLKNDIVQREKEKYQAELKKYGLKIFGIRLLITLPILAAGVFLFIRYRKNKFASLLWGYIIFSLYIFFFGLVPYLPSFGGYIRYIVGIIITVIAGYYTIRQLAAYNERKKSEMEKSSEERGRQVKHEAALKAYASNVCPSCDHNYLVGVVEKDRLPSYCLHCGLKLFEKCGGCGQLNFAHFPFCWNCGSVIKS